MKDFNELKLDIYPDDVWINLCNDCGWHSNICDILTDNICPNCDKEECILQLRGNPKEIGDYIISTLRR